MNIFSFADDFQNRVRAIESKIQDLIIKNIDGDFFDWFIQGNETPSGKEILICADSFSEIKYSNKNIKYIVDEITEKMLKADNYRISSFKISKPNQHKIHKNSYCLSFRINIL